MFQLIDRVLQLDSNVRRVLLYRVWTMIAGVIVVVFVPRYLSNETQGYYYTFQSIVALQVLFDLGLAQTVAQVASHEYAHVDDDLLTAGRADVRVAKLSYIKSAVADWYRWVSRLFVCSIVVVGAVYFTYFGEGFAWVWFGPWLALVVSTGVNLVLSPRMAMVEGAGWTGTVANLRFIQSMVGHVLLVACLVVHGELWSIVAVPATANVCSLVWLRISHNPYRRVPPYVIDVHDHLPWRQEIMSLQWRVAVAWLGGYFASQVLVPVVFALRGAEDAGRIGLGLQIFTAVQALGMSWVSARVPLFGQLISKGERSTLNKSFVKAAASAVVVTALLSAAIASVLEIIHLRGMFLANRVPSGLAIGVMAVTSTVGTLIYALAAYMRAHKTEPLVVSSVVIGLLNFVAVVIGGMQGTTAVIVAYAAVTICINLPWTLAIFARFYDRKRMGKANAGRADLAG